MESGDDWLAMSQNTTVGMGYGGEYRREACNDARLDKSVAKCDKVAFCDSQEEFIVEWGHLVFCFLTDFRMTRIRRRSILLRRSLDREIELREN